MQNLKSLLALSVIIVTPFLINSLDDGNPAIKIMAIVLPIIIVFHLAVRKSLSFKNYFTSKYNILTSNERSEKVYDIERDLMFEKMKEVIADSEFKLVASDKQKFEILATSKISSWSWGENLYFDFEDSGDKTIMKFCSTSLQIYAWGKNKQNVDDLLEAVESSFVI